jgi:hypothetical protein
MIQTNTGTKSYTTYYKRMNIFKTPPHRTNTVQQQKIFWTTNSILKKHLSTDTVVQTQTKTDSQNQKQTSEKKVLDKSNFKNSPLFSPSIFRYGVAKNCNPGLQIATATLLQLQPSCNHCNPT